MKDLFRVWLNPQNEAESHALPGLCCFSVSQRRYESNTSLSIGPLYLIQFEYFNTCNFSGECAATAVFSPALTLHSSRTQRVLPIAPGSICCFAPGRIWS